jgi:hypothetical protein
LTPYEPKNDFELEEKLHQQSNAEFDGESDGDCLVAQQLYFVPLSDPDQPPNWRKMKEDES